MTEVSQRENIVVVWFVWQFYEMPKILIIAWWNYVLFGLDYFSVPLLLKTLFSPWRRYNWVYPRGFDALEFLNTLLSNFFSRIIGAVCRIALIIVGSIAEFFIVVAGFLVVLFWLVIPFIIIIGLFFIFLF